MVYKLKVTSLRDKKDLKTLVSDYKDRLLELKKVQQKILDKAKVSLLELDIKKE